MIRFSQISRCLKWVERCFGMENLTDRKERAMRLLEEATELAQAEGVTWPQAVGIAGRVFSRPPGEPEKEAGGVIATLVCYCYGPDDVIHMGEALAKELQRIEQPEFIERVRARHAEKVAMGIAREANHAKP